MCLWLCKSVVAVILGLSEVVSGSGKRKREEVVDDARSKASMYGRCSG